MDKEIKFRGKSLKDGKWVYGSLVEDTCDGYQRSYIYDKTWDETEGGNGRKRPIWEVDPKTVGQFIGLLDKNKVEIYEGDVLATSNDGKDGCDIWNEKTFGYTQVIRDTASSRFRGTKWTWNVGDMDSVYDLNYIEIIGFVGEI